MTKAFPPKKSSPSKKRRFEELLPDVARMITDFAQSNGHGRRQSGLMPVGRQGNLIVTSTKTVKGF